jgi:hypothetical protein
LEIKLGTKSLVFKRYKELVELIGFMDAFAGSSLRLNVKANLVIAE